MNIFPEHINLTSEILFKSEATSFLHIIKGLLCKFYANIRGYFDVSKFFA